MSEAPDFAEPFTAWRVWRVIRSAGVYWLGSVVQDTRWPPGAPLRAECLVRRIFGRRRRIGHEAPHMKCECGIYGTSLEGVSPYLADAPCRGVARVVGRVALWGTVVECDRGYRASEAYPLELYVPVDAGEPWLADWREIAFGLARYGVPIEPLDSPAADAQRLLVQRLAA